MLLTRLLYLGSPFLCWDDLPGAATALGKILEFTDFLESIILRGQIKSCVDWGM